MQRFISVMVCLVAGIAAIQASALSDAANGLAPGQWVELSTGLTGQDLRPDTSAFISMLDYADSGGWDPIRKRAYFVGKQAQQRPWRFLIYNESSNSWSYGPLPSGIASLGHGYDHNTTDPTTGTHYFRNYGWNEKRIFKYNPASNSWSQISNINFNNTQVACAVAFFPERDGLVYFDGDWGSTGWNQSTNQWANINPQMNQAGDYHNFAEYNPVHKVVLYGGGNGSNRIFKVAQNGSVTEMGNSPVSLGSAHPTGALTTVDPNTGKFVVFKDGSGQWYDYDIASDHWTQLNASTMPPLSTLPDNGAIAISINTYGVIMFVEYRGGQAKVYVYKHSATTAGDTEAPTVPQNLAASVVDHSRINLTWSASSDNTAVTGYQVYRNGSLVGSATTPSYSDQGLSQSTTYTYHVTAHDAAGNQSAASNTATATTQAQQPPPPPGNPGVS